MNLPKRIRPRDAKDVAAAIADAVENGTCLEIFGHGTKAGIGKPSRAEHCVDLTMLAGIIDYAPSELVITAQAGTPLAEIESLVAKEGQMLAFEPLDFGPLTGAIARNATIGGILAANASGPRRLAVGAARDHFLGFVAVSGRGEIFKAGGRVVKNVTGFDVAKVMAGSWGTLAVLTEVSVRLVPQPRSAATVVIAGLSDRDAAQAMSKAMGSAAAVSGAAHLPASIATMAPEPSIAAGRMPVTALRLEGFGSSVTARIDILKSQLRGCGDIAVLDDGQTRVLWRFIRDGEPFGADERSVWRISVPPMEGWKIPAAVNLTGADWFYDWAGGLVWLAVPSGADALAPAIHRAAFRLQGHATLVRAPSSVRDAVACFPVQSPGVFALCERIKAEFDPHAVLNPGRMNSESFPA